MTPPLLNFADDHQLLIDELRVAFQPIVCATTEQACLHEALSRFNGCSADRVEGLICLIDETVGMSGIDLRVLELIQQNIQQYKGRALCVNVSQRTLQEAGHEYLDAAAALAANIQRLIVEVTESDRLKLPTLLREFIRDARSVGVSVAIDDANYRHDYGCPRMIEYLQPSIVKLCGRCTHETMTGGDQAKYQAILDAAHAVGAETVIEWIDSEQVRDFARAFRPTYLQGWLYGKPEIEI